MKGRFRVDPYENHVCFRQLGVSFLGSLYEGSYTVLGPYWVPLILGTSLVGNSKSEL